MRSWKHLDSAAADGAWGRRTVGCAALSEAFNRRRSMLSDAGCIGSHRWVLPWMNGTRRSGLVGCTVRCWLACFGCGGWNMPASWRLCTAAAADAFNSIQRSRSLLAVARHCFWETDNLDSRAGVEQDKASITTTHSTFVYSTRWVQSDKMCSTVWDSSRHKCTGRKRDRSKLSQLSNSSTEKSRWLPPQS